MALSLEKKQEIVRLTLEKRNVPDSIIMQVKAALDVSGSAQGFYSSGAMQELTDRLLPVAMRFDDNQSLECYAFGCSVCQVPDIKPEMFGNYIGKHFIPNVKRSVLWSGTSFSAALEQIKEDIAPTKSEKTGGFFGGLFGAKKEEKRALPNPPVYLKFITDGETVGDEFETSQILEQMGLMKTYIQLIGIGRGADFRFLKKMADKYGHVGFVTFPDLEKTSDQAMYEALLNEELCEWIKKQ